MASRARRDIRRNLLFILLALLALGGLIAFVGLVQRGTVPVLMPEKRAKFLERRANLADNGFATLTAAFAQLNSLGPVPQCEDLLRTGKLNVQRPVNPQNPLDSAANLCAYLGAGSFCPNDDPRFKEYMDKTEAVLTSIKAALERPCIFHTRLNIAADADAADDLEPVRGLIRHMNALALYHSAVSGDTAGATGILRDAIAVCDALDASGSFDLNLGDPHHEGPPGREGFFKVGLGFSAGTPWMTIPVLAKYAADRNEPLDALLEMTRPALDTPPDRSPRLVAYCMMLDDVMTGGDNVPSDRRFGQRLWSAITGNFAQRDARVLLEHEEAVLAAVNGPLKEFSAKIREIAGDGGMFGPKFMALQHELMQTAAALEARRILAGLAVRLEAFRKDRGDYPEKLDELVPQYMDKIPVHPRSGDALLYAKFKEGYRIAENNEPGDPQRPYRRFREDLTLDMRVLPNTIAPLSPPPAPPPPAPAPPAE